MPDSAKPDEFAIRLGSVESLFNELDARPVSQRRLTYDVRRHLLDEWDRLRDTSPSELVLHAPKGEREDTDEDAVREAIHADLHLASLPLRRGDPLPRSERIGSAFGVLVLFVSIVVSTWLSKNNDGVLVEGISQGIVVVGWVALWGPAAHFVVEVAPHVFNRRRYREFADIPLRFAWH
jgi:hypothetical protein